jgi:hypothetical protein
MVDKNHLPNNTTKLKTSKYRNAWRDYTFKKGISQKRMREVLSDFGELSEKVTITFDFK